MTYLLVIYFFSANEPTQSYNMALFVDHGDCQLAGELMTRYINTNAKANVVTKFSCDETA